MSYTKGPWLANETLIKSNNGRYIASAHIPRLVSEDREESESWLDMRKRTQPERDSINKEKLANAKLIAAAPDLVEALQYLLHCSEEFGTFSNGVTDPSGSIDEGRNWAMKAMQMADEALKKAGIK